MGIEDVRSSLSGPAGEARVCQRGRWWIVEFQGKPGVGGLLANSSCRGDAMAKAAALVNGDEVPRNPKGRVPGMGAGPWS